MPGFIISGACFNKMEITILDFLASLGEGLSLYPVCAVPGVMGSCSLLGSWVLLHYEYLTVQCIYWHLLPFQGLQGFRGFYLKLSNLLTVRCVRCSSNTTTRRFPQGVPVSRGDAAGGKFWKHCPSTIKQRETAVDLNICWFYQISVSYQQASLVSTFCYLRKQNTF